MTRREALRRVTLLIESGVARPVCVCDPKRSDVHACPVDPQHVDFTDLLMRLKRPPRKSS